MDLLSKYSDDEEEVIEQQPRPVVPQETYSDESDEDDEDCENIDKSSSITNDFCSDEPETNNDDTHSNVKVTHTDSAFDAYITSMKIPILNQVGFFVNPVGV